MRTVKTALLIALVSILAWCFTLAIACDCSDDEAKRLDDVAPDSDDDDDDEHDDPYFANREIIDGGSPGNNVGTYSRLVFGTDGQILIGYHDETNGSLKVASSVQAKSIMTPKQGGWITEVAEDNGNTGRFLSSIINNTGNLQISHVFYDSMIERNGLLITTQTGGGWTTESVEDSETEEYGYTDLACDASGNLAVSYLYVDSMIERNGLRLANNAGDEWEINALDENLNGHISYTSLALTPAGGSYISYMAADEDGSTVSLRVIYSDNLSSGWDSEFVDDFSMAKSSWSFKADDPQTGYTDLLLDGDGYVHVAYAQPSLGTGLLYATNMSGDWESYVVDGAMGAGYYLSLAMDEQRNAYLSYYDASTSSLMFASNRSGAWITATVDSVGDVVGLYTSIAVDEDSNIHTSYYSDYGLWYASFPAEYTLDMACEQIVNELYNECAAIFPENCLYHACYFYDDLLDHCQINENYMIEKMGYSPFWNCIGFAAFDNCNVDEIYACQYPAGVGGCTDTIQKIYDCEFAFVFDASNDYARYFEFPSLDLMAICDLIDWPWDCYESCFEWDCWNSDQFQIFGDCLETCGKWPFLF